MPLQLLYHQHPQELPPNIAISGTQGWMVWDLVPLPLSKDGAGVTTASLVQGNISTHDMS
jgi:hypothetical protein